MKYIPGKDMTNPPDQIWLQWDAEEGSEGEIEITWCEDQINDSDVEYVRKDIYDELRALLVEHHSMHHIIAAYEAGMHGCIICMDNNRLLSIIRRVKE